MTSGQALSGTTGFRVNLRLQGYPLWIGGGTIGLVLVAMLGWYLLIGPEYAKTDRLREQTATAQDSMTSLRQKLALARKQNIDFDSYQAELAKARAALPGTSGLSTFLTDVQAASVNAGVEVRGLTVGTPLQADGTNGQIYALPITINAAGTAPKLDAFLNRLQRVQPRAVLISTASLAPDASSLSLAGAATMILGMRAYVDPSSRTTALAAPTPTASSPR
jgi:Tfp pilus assembly protein PilO